MKPSSKKTPERRTATRAPRRRALSHAPAPAEPTKDAAGIAARLAAALDVRLDDRAVSPHIHGFHSYPARMHPETAALLIEAVSRPGERLLDPFAGSGTVLVEARRLGRHAIGIDANPLAVRLARLKADPPSEADRAALAGAAARVAEHAEARRAARAGPTRRYGAADRDLFAVHVLLELDGLRSGIAELPPGAVRATLELVLSSILIKVSRQPGDTAHDRRPRRFASGFTIRLFADKTRELAERLDAFLALVPDGAPRPTVRLGDARELRGIDEASIDAVVTSPPYPGVYDYAEHHAVRLRWLELDEELLPEKEMGARRSGKEDPSAAWRSWQADLGRTLGALGRVLRPGGRAAMVVADSVLGGRAVLADDYVPRLAAEVGLEWVAGARQPRPHAHPASRRAFGRHRRYEHVLVLERRAPAEGRGRGSRQQEPPRR